MSRRGHKSSGQVLKYSHTRKRCYSTWARAFWALIQVKRRCREIDYDGEPYWGRVYECSATNTPGVKGVPHYHVGRPPRTER